MYHRDDITQPNWRVPAVLYKKKHLIWDFTDNLLSIVLYTVITSQITAVKNLDQKCFIGIFLYFLYKSATAYIYNKYWQILI